MTTLFSPNSVFNVPFGSNAEWSPNGQLSSGQFYLTVNTSGTGYDDTLYQASDSDPTVTVTGATNWQGNAYGPITLHIPAGAQPADSGDSQMNVISDGMLYSFYNFNWTGSNTATASYSAIENANGSGVVDAPSGQFDGSDYDFAVGAITNQDLTDAQSTGSIKHMLRIAIPETLAHSYDPNSTNVLAPNAGPQTMEDGYANGAGLPPGQQGYSGTLNYGVTVGIPKGVAEPADIKANAGANILWNTLQTHGAMVRDTDGTGNNIDLYAAQDVNPNDPLIAGMDQYGAEIERYLQVLSNQSASNPNGNPGSNWMADGSTGSGSGGAPKPSPNGTIITPGHGSIIANGDTYTLTTGDVATENGSAIPGGSGTAKMEFYSGKIYGQDANSHSWYIWNQSEWVSSSAPTGTNGGGGPSPSGTIITPGHGSFIDGAGHTYTLTASDVAMENGNPIPGGSGTSEMEFYGNKVYGHDAHSQAWYTWNQSEWVSAAAPPHV